ncbi:MAG: hypothetical protein VYB01_10050, partial [Pseudomonadota bacterium]|nr:hypothetical protein [Pseudomonadota bacterium]
GKPMTEGGCVNEIERSYRAVFCWQDERDIKGPRRAEKRRAEEDLEALREASVGLADPEARRAALAAEAHRLQQQAETEQRVELFAHRLSQQRAHLQPSVGQQRQRQQPSVLVRQQEPVPEQQARRAQSHQASEELSGSEDEWEVEEVDDGMVAYAWKSKDELLQQWDEQQHKELPLPPVPEPSCADEASLLLAQLRPSRRTPQELKSFLKARANPDIVVTTEISRGICPLSKVIGFAKATHVPRTLQSTLSMDLRGSLCTPLWFSQGAYTHMFGR